MADLLAHLLRAAPPSPTPTGVRAWWDATATARAAFASTIDRALAGGALADRLAFAFANGYAEALRALVPSLDHVAALCATEESGNHPRAIRTSLTPVGPDRFALAGRKKWASIADQATTLLVVASTGEDDTGKNRLRVVRVPVTATGVHIHAAAAPFVPEIMHAEIELDGVEIAAADVLPGDGYDAYLKPFRTIEDLHVHAAVVAYLIGVARRHALPRESIEGLLSLAVTTRALATADRAAATTHLALAGLVELAARLVADVERAWAASPAAAGDEWQRWQRDRALLQVASKARAARRDTAWSRLASG